MTKLEEVARAIHASQGLAPISKWGIDLQSYDALLPQERKAFEEAARAAILALLEPSGAMIKAGQPWAVRNAPPNCWVKMIDAILQEKP